MNKLTPYEQSLSEQLADLPVPSEDQAWLQMKKLLDEDDDDGAIVPPPKSGCGLLGIILTLLLAGGAVYFLQPQKWFTAKHNKTDSSAKNITVKDKRSTAPVISNTGPGRMDSITVEQNSGNRVDRQHIDDSVLPRGSVSDPKNKNVIAGRSDIAEGKGSIITSTAKGNMQIRTGSQETKDSGINKSGRTYTLKVLRGKSKNAVPYKIRGSSILPAKRGNAANIVNSSNPNTAKRKKVKNTGKTGPGIKASVSPGETGSEQASIREINNDSTQLATIINTEPVTDASAVDSVHNIKKEDTTQLITKIKADSAAKARPAERNKKRYHTGMGVAAFKGLPLNGATDVAVNNSGRRSAISDYIPSVYIRLYREKKWFLQGEYRYGVPQYTKEFVYKQNVKVDSVTQTLSTTSFRLRKTYYNQIPFSFNYLILPGWSLGTGIVYNKLTGAISEESLSERVPGTVLDSLISIDVVNDKKDSSFVKSTFQWQVETQYKWRRFSIGGRYAQGLQPYIKYTDPATNLPVSKRNNSVYLFIRYEIWNSRKKMVGYGR